MQGWLNLSVAVLVVAALCGCQEQTGAYPQRQPPAGWLQDDVQQAAGHQLFLKKCAVCHGKQGEGHSERAAFFEPPAPDFTETRYREVDPAYLYWRIDGGKTIEPFRSRGSVMPAWGLYFTPEQIWQLVAYLKSRSK